MNLKSVLIFLFTIVSINGFSQKTEDSSDHYEHHKNEIGVGNSPVYFINEKIFAYGLHIHYTHTIPKTKFELGIGYEHIFGEHRHNTFGLIASYNPIEKIHFAVSPGLVFEGKDSKAHFAMHFETSYDFEIKNVHFGPALEFAYNPKDPHLSLGLHIGFGF